MLRVILLLVLTCTTVFAKTNLSLSLNNQVVFRQPEELLRKLPEDVIYGKPSAKAVMVVFDSYSCIHCARFYNELFPILEEKYIKTGKLFFIHKTFPLDKRALFASKVVTCVKNKQEAIKTIYQNQKKLVMHNKYQENLLKMNGVDAKCVQNIEDEGIAKQSFEYSKVLDIRGTPTIFLNGKRLEKFSKESLIKQIEAAI